MGFKINPLINQAVREIKLINESGMYSLIMSSKMESAKKFKKWVTSEVLPSIRKTGSYSMPSKNELPSDYIEALEALLKSEKEKRALAEAKKAAEEAARKAAAAGKTNNSTAKGNTGSTTTTSTGSSSLRWPCPASGRITSGFGKRKSPTAGASSNHKGIDISASTGSSIVAAAGGTVSIATYSYSAGNYVVVNHGNGLSTVYMHCSQLLVSAGDTVKAGQTIAKVGSTGYSTGSHLHFAVRKNGSYVNPSSYVSP